MTRRTPSRAPETPSPCEKERVRKGEGAGEGEREEERTARDAGVQYTAVERKINTLHEFKHLCLKMAQAKARI